jgi:hypothetical protein
MCYHSRQLVPLGAHTTPESGKHVETILECIAGMPWGIIETDLTEAQRQVMDRVAVSDLGRPYDFLHTCEDDVFGFSPTRENIIGGAIAIGLLYLFWRGLNGGK